MTIFVFPKITLLGCVYRLQASEPKHAPPGNFGDNFFGKLIHKQVEIRLSAKISTLGEAMRALFFKMASKIQYTA